MVAVRRAQVESEIDQEPEPATRVSECACRAALLSRESLEFLTDAAPAGFSVRGIAASQRDRDERTVSALANWHRNWHRPLIIRRRYARSANLALSLVKVDCPDSTTLSNSAVGALPIRRDGPAQGNAQIRHFAQSAQGVPEQQYPRKFESGPASRAAYAARVILLARRRASPDSAARFRSFGSRVVRS